MSRLEMRSMAAASGGRAALMARVALAALLACIAQVAAAGEAAFRYEAPIVVEQGGAFLRLALPVNAYAHSRQPSLADLRIVDARGERVPFALAAPRSPQAQETESTRPVEIYPLPPRRPGQAEPAGPLEVQVVGDRITVRRYAGAAGPAGAAARSGPVPGWLFDLGERASGEAQPDSLRLSWSAPAEFSAGFDLEVSDDLRRWRSAGGGQLLALNSASGRLTQPKVMLPAGGAPRFVRLRWVNAADAPVLSSAVQVRLSRGSVVLDAPTALMVQPATALSPSTPSTLSTPTTQSATSPAAKPTATATLEDPGALLFDLGAVLPVVAIDLALPAVQRVAPVRVQGRSRLDEPWRDLALTVFYRIERGAGIDRPPPLALQANVRYLRLVPDPRSGPLPATPLAVQAQLLTLVFPAQGQAPYRLLAGSADAAPGALAISTLVPAFEEERARLGRAVLGAWNENEAVAREEAWQQRLVTWRPVLLWSVLLLGVASLGSVVWRLARRGPG